MESNNNKKTNIENNESSEALLEKLKVQLNSSNASIRRRAGFNLSWMQEDGLEILKSVLFGNYPVTTKNAAAYGLRKMQGRMKKMALEVLMKGLKSQDRSTIEICRNALSLLGHKVPNGHHTQKKRPKKSPIREIHGNSRPRKTIRSR